MSDGQNLEIVLRYLQANGPKSAATIAAAAGGVPPDEIRHALHQLDALGFIYRLDGAWHETEASKSMIPSQAIDHARRGMRAVHFPSGLAPAAARVAEWLDGLRPQVRELLSSHDVAALVRLVEDR